MQKFRRTFCAAATAAAMIATMLIPASAAGSPPSAPGSGSGGGANTSTYDYSGTLSGTLTADGSSVSSEDGKTYASDTKDKNAALSENSGTLTIVNGIFTKSGDDTDGDNCNFYGINSILLASGSGSKAYISKSSLSAESQGSNGIFSTNSAAVYAYSDKISTTAANSRGLDATYGGAITADSLDISTKGDHCAAVATDRGGGYISVTNSKFSTAGSGSPLIYSTGDIEADNVTGTASGSQIAGMEGLNTIRIYNSTLESTITKATASDPIADGIIIYQSTSGDAETTTGSKALFESSDSTLKSAVESGAMFYFTNTAANVVLSNTKLDFDSDKAGLMQVTGNDSNNWGTAGSNGANVTFTGIGQTLSGDITVDTISSLDLYLLKNSTYTGAAKIVTNSVNTSKISAPLTVNIDSTSKWVLTADTTVSSLNAQSGAKIVDSDGKTVSIVVNGTKKVSGTSSITLTVTGSYSTDVTTDSDNALSTDFLDRTAFDKMYSTNTTFGTNGSSETTTTTEAASDDDTAVTASNSSNKTLIIIIIAAAVVAAGAVTFIIIKKKKKAQ